MMSLRNGIIAITTLLFVLASWRFAHFSALGELYNGTTSYRYILPVTTIVYLVIALVFRQKKTAFHITFAAVAFVIAYCILFLIQER